MTDFWPGGKTSINSRLNIPGRLAWVTMETPGMITLIYIMVTLPKKLGLEGQLPWLNWLLAGGYVLHYMQRAIITPLFLNPSMSPFHILVWASAFFFNVTNAACIGGYLAGYGPLDYSPPSGRVIVGVSMFVIGMVSNWYHDSLLRNIRHRAKAQQRQNKKANVQVDKHYEIPSGGLFEYIYYPNYVSEWFEWTGWWIVGGGNFVPAQYFVANEVATMMPSALRGRRWYVKTFGPKAAEKAAVLPGVL
jgi:3-oxo-5-alpha-steroid 4-dehydrogenase 1